MPLTELAPESLATAAAGIPENTPIVMLNLVRYREEAEYSGATDLPPCSGREAYYQRYAPAFARVAALSGNENAFKPILLASVLVSLLVPEGESWDDLVLVEYNSFAALRTVLDSPEYERDAAPHRRAALQDWRFLAMQKQLFG